MIVLFNSPYDDTGSYLIQQTNLDRIDVRIPAEYTLNGKRSEIELQFVYEANVTLSLFYDVFEDDSEVHATISEDLEVQATFSEDYKKQTTFTESSEAPQDSPDDASRAHRAAADDSEAQTASTDISHPRISAVDDPAVTEDIGEFNKQLFGAEADDEDSFFDALGSLLGLEPAADEPPEDAERGDSITTPSALPFDELFSAS